MKRMRVTAVIAMLAMLLLPGAILADVLEHVPAEAIVVVKFNNLKAVSDKFAKLATDLGVAAMAPPLADPLNAIQQKMKITNGVNTAGDAAFVFFNPEQYGNDEDKSFILLVPVSDYQAFLGNWPEAKTEGGISAVHIGEDNDEGDNGFVANWGTYAAMSPLKDLVANKPTAGVTFPAATAKELAGKDAVVVANFKTLGPQLLPKLKEHRDEMLKEIEQDITSDPDAAKFAPVIKAFMNQLLDTMEGFLATNDASSLGISLTGDGILLTLMSDYKPDSYMGQALSQVKPKPENLLAGLPAGKYLMFGGSVSDPEQAVKMIDDFAQPILKEVLAMGPEYKPAEDYYAALKDYISANTGTTFGLIAPATTQDGVVQAVSILRGDAPKIADSYKRMAMAQEKLMLALGLPADQLKVTFTPNAKTVDGVSFDALKSDIGGAAADQMMSVMNIIYGPSGPTVHMAVVDGKLVQTVGSVKDETVSALIVAAKSGASPLADLTTVKMVGANLPKDHAAVMYIALDEIVNTGLALAKTFGFNMPIQLPPDLPPVGVSIACDGPSARIDAYIPNQLVQSLVAAGMQAAMQMQGGRQGGGGGL